MDSSSNYSPHIVIYFEVGDQIIRLSDVMRENATLYDSEFSEVPSGTLAFLVIDVDGEQRRRPVVLDEGVVRGKRVVNFSQQLEKSVFDPEDFSL